jgi:hypothetical protein
LRLSCDEQTLNLSPKKIIFKSKPGFFAEKPVPASSVTSCIVVVTLFDGALMLTIVGGERDQQLAFLAQVYRSSIPQSLIIEVEDFCIREEEGDLQPRLSWQGNVERSQWLELFHSFTVPL